MSDSHGNSGSAPFAAVVCFLVLALYPAPAASQPKRPIVLAQEFLLPPPGPPRAACNSVVNAGGDNGDTVPIDVSGTTGTVEFKYETYSQPDRMVVFIDRQLVFDSGCLGTMGYRSQFIRLPEGAMNLTVRVEPNCMGGSNTTWAFSLQCPVP
jgi:hypothetical protein